MPSQLYDNSEISFVCARNFTYNGKKHAIGADFPKDDLAGNPEALVRSRYLIPVVEEWGEKPRHWHRHVQLKSIVLGKLGHSGESLLNKPERVPSSKVVASEDLPVKETEEKSDAFDPSEHTVEEVNEYLATEDLSVEEYNRVVQAEIDGKARKTILNEHEVQETAKETEEPTEGTSEEEPTEEDEGDA